MLRARWATTVAMLLAASACIEARGYRCDDTDQCVLAGVDGRCEAEGWCSYPDDDCPGGYRFEALAPDALAGSCVDDVTDCDAGPCAATRLVVGDTHACVVDGDGQLFCWGSNVFGQLGNGSTAPAERCPGPVAELGPIEHASASRQVCARDGDQRLSCWGHNDVQQVDWHAGVAEIVRTPLEIVGLASVPAVVDVGPSLSCIANAMTVTCWGRLPPSAEAPLSIPTPAPVTMLATGDAHVCALLVDGRVTCVGDDSLGQLGDGDPGPLVGPLVPSFPIADAIAIDAGPDHTCAVLTDDVVCWGANDGGQCGSPSSEVVATATSVTGRMAGPYAQIALGGRHSCLRAQDGRVQCWGDDASGQLGVVEQGVGAHPVVLADGTPLVALEIGAGALHTCARTSVDVVECWGDNGSLQLGAPSSELTRTHHTLAFGCE